MTCFSFEFVHADLLNDIFSSGGNFINQGKIHEKFLSIPGKKHIRHIRVENFKILKYVKEYSLRHIF